MVPGSGAARDLRVDERVLVGEAVLGEQPLGRGRKKTADRETDRREAVAHPVEVLGDAITASARTNHLVDRVAEEEAPVERRDARPPREGIGRSGRRSRGGSLNGAG